MVAAPETTTEVPVIEVAPAENTEAEPVENMETTEEEAPVTKESATELLNQGKRNVFCGNVSEAVNDLSEACEQLNKLHGEQNEECALGYYWYGYALLELARIETDVLGNAMKGIPTSPGRNEEDKESKVVVEDPDKLTEEERAEVEQQVSEALDTLAPKEEEDEATDEDSATEEDTETEKNSEGSKEGTSEAMEAETKDSDKPSESAAEKDQPEIETTEAKTETEEESAQKTTDAKADETEPKTAEDENVENTEGDSVDEAANATDDEEDDSLKLAWEMLELARKVYDASSLENKQEMLSQCYLKLGEVLMETGHHDDADTEFHKCIKIQTDVLERCDRAIGEAYFLAGLNMIIGKNFQKAKDYFKTAIDCINEKKALLTTKKESLSNDSDDAKKVEDELKELEDLLPNMQEKLQDAELNINKSNTTSESAESEPASTDKPTDIGHLVKRKNTEIDCETHKRKTDVVENGDGADAKKAKLVTDTENNEKVVTAEV